MSRNLFLPTCSLLLLSLTCVGCSSLRPTSWKPSSLAWWQGEQEELEPQIPHRLVSTWVDTVKHTPGQMSERGFGGRILFFNKESTEPVAVEGQLVIYAFDESEGDPTRVEPTRRFIFPAEQFAKHQSQCQLGPSYSVWLPWDKVGGPLKNVSLITRFEPKGGPLIVGDQTSHLLPGEQLVEDMPTKQKSLPTIQLTQHAENLPSMPPTNRSGENRKTVGLQPAGETAKRALTTTRIPVPQKWNER